MSNIFKLPLAALIALSCILGVAGSAYAASTPLGTTRIIETADSKKACVNPLIENPFAQFGDNLDYVLAPDGNFNGDVAGWQFAGGANVVATDKGRSLQMPRGATAITPSMCLDLHFPTFRMYHKVVRNKNGLLVLGKADKAVIKVEVVYHQIANPMWTEMKSFDGRNGIYVGDSWKLTDHIDLKPDLGGSQPGARQAALRFTVLNAESNESFLLDDIYIDPMRR